MADQDIVKGKLKQGEGKAQNAFGNVTGDIDRQVQGAAKQVEGKVQEGWGRLKDAVQDADDDLAARRERETSDTV